MYIEPGLEELVHNLLGSLQPNMATMMGIEFSKLTKDECVLILILIKEHLLLTKNLSIK